MKMEKKEKTPLQEGEALPQESVKLRSAELFENN